VHVYADLDAACAAETKLGFVDVATPPSAHAASVVAALDRGLHVLCEKPLAVGAAEVAEIRRAARRSGRSVFTVHNWKYAPLFRRLHGLLRAGVAGELASVEWQVLRPSPPRDAATAGWRLDREQAGGGILMDHGWHAFYLLLYLTGRAPRSIVARTKSALAFGVEDRADLEIDLAGLPVTVELAWGAPERRTAGVVRGSLGEVRFEDDRVIVAATGREPEETRFSPPISASSYHPEWFPALLGDFRMEMEHLEARGRNLAEAVTVAEMMAAAYRSQGERVALGEPLEAAPENA